MYKFKQKNIIYKRRFLIKNYNKKAYKMHPRKCKKKTHQK